MTAFRMTLSAVALAALVAAPAAEAKTQLAGRVGPQATISLKLNGKRVTTLPPGVYLVAVSDRSGEHNFHLKGNGVNKVITGIAYTGTKKVAVTLKKGKYRFFCDPHSTFMKGSFTVT
jgi:plastocyanin